MNFSVDELEMVNITFTHTHFIVGLKDGRFLSIPIHWFPRLAFGTLAERANYELLDGAIHWPDLDEDIEIEGLLNGHRSTESQQSLNRFYHWMRAKRAGETTAPFAAAFDDPAD